MLTRLPSATALDAVSVLVLAFFAAFSTAISTLVHHFLFPIRPGYSLVHLHHPLHGVICKVDHFHCECWPVCLPWLKGGCWGLLVGVLSSESLSFSLMLRFLAVLYMMGFIVTQQCWTSHILTQQIPRLFGHCWCRICSNSTSGRFGLDDVNSSECMSRWHCRINRVSRKDGHWLLRIMFGVMWQMLLLELVLFGVIDRILESLSFTP